MDADSGKWQGHGSNALEGKTGEYINVGKRLQQSNSRLQRVH